MTRFQPLRLCLALLLLAQLACARGTSAPETPLPATPINAPTPAATATLTQPAAVPAEYREIYDSLAQTLTEAQGRCTADDSNAAPVFGAELVVANGNRGEALLQPNTLAGVRLYLDRLQALGVQGVTVEIKFPLLQEDFPRSAEYLQFYKEVAQAVQGRGLTLLIESGPPFPDAQYSTVPFDPASYTVESYLAARQAHNARIVRAIQPDYFSFVEEPDTEQMLLGFAISVDEYVRYVQATLAGIGETETHLGAGAGAWDDPVYVRRFLEETGLDFINLHFYPLAGPSTNYLERAREWMRLARAQGRAVLIGEAWLYKTLPSELGRVHYADVFARDAYSFWQPLDNQFMQTLACLARAEQVSYLSFFWSGYFFDYLEYEPALPDLTPVERQRRINEAQVARIRAGEFSATGAAYRELIRQDAKP